MIQGKLIWMSPEHTMYCHVCYYDALQHNYPDEEQKSVNFMMNPLIRSLTAAQTTTDPKNKIQITQRTKCITFTSSSLIKESTVKRVKEKYVFPSFSRKLLTNVLYC